MSLDGTPGVYPEGASAPYEIHPDALYRGDYAFVLPTGEGTGVVLAGVDYILRMKEAGRSDIETVMLTPPEGRTLEQVLADLDKSLADSHGFLWPSG